MAALSTESFLRMNPGIRYTTFFLDTEPSLYYKERQSCGEIDVRLVHMQDHNPPVCKEVFQAFWFRYAVAPRLLSTDWVAQVDTDIVNVIPLPLDEVNSGRLNGCIDVSIESSKQLLKTLDSYGWWLPSMYRKVYINAGFLLWEKRLFSWVFEEMDKRMRQDAVIGVLDRAPFGDQPYINAIMNSRDDMMDILHILPSKWNIGVWSKEMRENARDLMGLKKAVAFHVFGAAGDDRFGIIESIFKDHVGEFAR